jgi:ubiquinone biosynthesis protein
VARQQRGRPVSSELRTISEIENEGAVTKANDTVDHGMSIQKQAARLITIVAVVVRHSVTGLFQIAKSKIFPHRSYPRASAAYHIRLTLQDLGPTFVKLGQVLATRSDLVPITWQRELAQLRDHASSIPTSVITAMLERSLQEPISRFFEVFEPAPVACASIAQVHRAILADGRLVAVKIRRPDIQTSIEADLSLVRWPLRLIMLLSGRARSYDLVGLLDEFSSLLRAETNLGTEARNIEKLSGLFDEDPRVSIPRVIFQGSGDAVLIMEWIEGIQLNDSSALNESELDRPAIAGAIAHAYATMIFKAPLFHADPQPSNLLATWESRLGVVDFGEVGRIDPATRSALMSLIGSVLTENVDGLADAVLSVSRATRPVDRAELGKQLSLLVRPVIGAQLGDLRLGEIFRDLLAILQKFGIHLSVSLALLIKTLTMCEATCVEIHPSFQMSEFLSELQMAGSNGWPLTATAPLEDPTNSSTGARRQVGTNEPEDSP